MTYAEPHGKVRVSTPIMENHVEKDMSTGCIGVSGESVYRCKEEEFGPPDPQTKDPVNVAWL